MTNEILACDQFPIGVYRKILESAGNDFLTKTLIRNVPCSYIDFVDLINSDIDDIVSRLQENPELYGRDSEDRTTIEIVNSLRALGYDASHDTKIGGHADITVRGKAGHLWLGEAKNHSDYQHLFDGFQQLTTRYAVGDENQDQGGLLIYIKDNKNSSNVIKSWKENLTTREIVDLEFIDSTARGDHVFFTTHSAARTGRKFTVRHIGVSLYFNPRDQGTKKA